MRMSCRRVRAQQLSKYCAPVLRPHHRGGLKLVSPSSPPPLCEEHFTDPSSSLTHSLPLLFTQFKLFFESQHDPFCPTILVRFLIHKSSPSSYREDTNLLLLLHWFVIVVEFGGEVGVFGSVRLCVLVEQMADSHAKFLFRLLFFSIIVWIIFMEFRLLLDYALTARLDYHATP
ncbi:hypothetical protein Dimus_004972 [Dionaea muscipula]